jgi:hypothetical protein
MTIMPALIRSTVACTVASAVASAVACAVVMIASHAIAGPFTFDDVDYWVGTGTSRAALVIDWVENSTEPAALVWGYRWDGTAYGRDMLTAIVAADDRLFAKLGGSPTNPVAVYGLGYDANNDGTFALDGGSGFDAGGFAYTGPADGSTSLDAADYYAEGWFTGFWHFGIASLNPYDGGSWSDIPADCLPTVRGTVGLSRRRSISRPSPRIPARQRRHFRRATSIAISRWMILTISFGRASSDRRIRRRWTVMATASSTRPTTRSGATTSGWAPVRGRPAMAFPNQRRSGSRCVLSGFCGLLLTFDER